MVPYVVSVVVAVPVMHVLLFVLHVCVLFEFAVTAPPLVGCVVWSREVVVVPYVVSVVVAVPVMHVLLFVLHVCVL